MNESETQATPDQKDQPSNWGLGCLILAVAFASVGFGIGLLKGLLDEEEGDWALGLDLGWKHAVLFCLMIALTLPLVMLLKRFGSPPVVTGVVVMSVGFAFMRGGGAIIEEEWDSIGRNLLSGAGQGAIVGFGVGNIHRLGWVKSPFS